MLRTSFVPSSNFHPQLSVSSDQNNSYIRHTYPKMFEVILLGCSNDKCDIDPKYAASNVTIINEDYSLWRMYANTLHDSYEASLVDLSEISNEPMRNLTSIEIDLVAKTLENVLVKQYRLVSDEALAQMNQPIIAWRRETMLNIFCKFMNPKRVDLVGDLRFFQLLEDLLYLDVTQASTMKTYLDSPGLVYKKYSCEPASFNYVCARVNSSQLASVWFQGEYFQMNFTTRFDKRFRGFYPFFSPSLFQMCLIEMISTNWLGRDLKKNLLENKALSLRYNILNLFCFLI